MSSTQYLGVNEGLNYGSAPVIGVLPDPPDPDPVSDPDPIGEASGRVGKYAGLAVSAQWMNRDDATVARMFDRIRQLKVRFVRFRVRGSQAYTGQWNNIDRMVWHCKRIGCLPIFMVGGTRQSNQSPEEFDTGTRYNHGLIIEPIPTKYFQVTTAGTSGNTVPNWPSAMGATVNSGTVRFTKVDVHPTADFAFPIDESDFGQECGYVAARYKPGAAYWSSTSRWGGASGGLSAGTPTGHRTRIEVWNEANIRLFVGTGVTPSKAQRIKIARMQEWAYYSIKDEDPNAFVVTGGLANVGFDSGMGMVEFTHNFLKNLTGSAENPTGNSTTSDGVNDGESWMAENYPHFDAYCLHLYLGSSAPETVASANPAHDIFDGDGETEEGRPINNTNSFQNNTNVIAEMLRDRGIPDRIVVTEGGYERENVSSANGQAYVRRLMEHYLNREWNAHSEAFFCWYTLNDHATGPGQLEGFWTDIGAGGVQANWTDDWIASMDDTVGDW